MQDLLPLFAVYEGRHDDVKLDYAKLESALKRAFAPDQSRVLKEFTSRGLQQGEAVDVFASKLTRIACRVVSKMDLQTVVERDRVPVSASESSVGAISLEKNTRNDTRLRSSTPVKCFACQNMGHIARNCPEKKSDSKEAGANFSCFCCGEKSHVARYCPAKGTKHE
ncbi:unnamed protein product [Sphagnum balticum]